MLKDHIYIVGAGAIGQALAVFLSLNQRKVTLLRGSVDDGKRYLKKIRVVLDSAELEAEIEVNSLQNFPVLDGIIVLTNKSFGNEKLAHLLKDKVGHSPIVLLQNGLDIEQAFIAQGIRNVFRCVLFVTSQLLEDGRVKFKPVSGCPVGVIDGDAALTATIVEKLTSTHFSFEVEPNIQPVIWRKAIVNTVFNSVCPLLDADNGVFHREAAALGIARGIIEECLHISRAKGISLALDEILETLLLISRRSDGQLISTLQDIRAGRETEIDTLNFAIVAISRSVGMEHLVPQTKLLGEMIKLKTMH